jgi:AraC-like DNA-binding protein
MFLSEIPPSQKLSPFVSQYWEGSFNLDKSGEIGLDITPHGCLEIIIHLNDLHCDIYRDGKWEQSPDYMVIGMFTQSHKVLFQSRVNAFGIRFKPDGFYRIFGVPPADFLDAYENIALVLDRQFREFGQRIREAKTKESRIALSEKFLMDCLSDNDVVENYVDYAAQMIRHYPDIRILDLADKVHISQRQLERRFKDRIGISPKHYLRLNRIQKAIQYLNLQNSNDLFSVAYSCGYFDQAHFINDFKKITGLNPTTFVKAESQMMSNGLD